MKDIATRSLEAAKVQLRSVDTRINLAQQRLENANKLIAKGFSKAPRGSNWKARLRRWKAKRSEYLADLATQEAAVVNSDAGMEAFLHNERPLPTAFNSTKREREALVSTLNDSIKALAAYNEATTTAESAVITYTVLRTKDGKTEEIPATELTPIEPGDLSASPNC